jgi:hypothetical protein
VTGWLRCFAHLADEAGRDLGSMDHDLLGGEPQPAEWAPGDEGYETRFLELGPGSGREGRLALGPGGYEIHNSSVARLWLGLYDTGTGGRLPVVSSTLPVVEACTAVALTANTVPGAEVVFRLEPAPLQTCRVAFESGLELTGYAVTRAGSTVWLRLRWRAPEQDGEPARFFGHGVTQTDAEAESLLSFDQELSLERRLRGQEFEVYVFRTMEAASPAFLRGGVCTSLGLERRAIRASSLAYHEQSRCFFLPLT